MRPITVDAEFCFELEQDGFTLATFDCRATADVRPSEPRTRSDPGCGPEVENFRNIEVEGIRYDISRPRDARRQRRRLKPHDTLRDWILAYLNSGKADGLFEDAATDAGRDDPDYRRQLLADNAAE